jgi:hypothetical protein
MRGVEDLGVVDPPALTDSEVATLLDDAVTFAQAGISAHTALSDGWIETSRALRKPNLVVSSPTGCGGFCRRPRGQGRRRQIATECGGRPPW